MSILIANWKMNGSAERVRGFAHALNHAVQAAPTSVRAVFCPPMPYIAAAKAALPQNARLALGAQDCHAAAQGAYTGEVAAAMLADVGCRYVILGHSERRAAGEECPQVAAKAEAAIAAGLVPVLCIGESAEEYAGGNTAEVLKRQLAYLEKLPAARYIIAYEPIWAIGSGKTPTTGEIETAHSLIKSALGSETAVLYGGSVNAGNAKEILGLSSVSGALIGGASLEISSMRAILAAAKVE